ncbi:MULTISPECIES: hypothetical protein [Microbispora]|uniref:Uncharacterized protein n=1 Tax=Microbispora siamensis TaxID=564413 RepID=A0ABQ4GK22_9ACTN|nr:MULTISPECIES: hypothetical protein [Microbispora]OPG07920.1 hypothetical protein B1L11_29215 [Microbispora sp. GKU 823]GIH61767.1 hypothetical protein Msi02_25840 [Microbispora siamensis]
MTTQDDRGAAALARAHGLFNIAGGLWPLLHLPSFEKVFGAKTDRWLERTVAGLLVGIGWTQIRAASTPGGADHARRLGMATAATLLAVDLVYVPMGRVRPTYLLDAAAEAMWLRAWRARAVRPEPPSTRAGSMFAAAAALAAGCATGGVLAARMLRRRRAEPGDSELTRARYIRHPAAR